MNSREIMEWVDGLQPNRRQWWHWVLYAVIAVTPVLNAFTGDWMIVLWSSLTLFWMFMSDSWQFMSRDYRDLWMFERAKKTLDV